MSASPLFDQVKDPVGKAILERARPIQLAASTTLFRQGDACANYLIVLQGSVKVFSRAENGREMLLYRVQDGQSCTLTTACLFANNRYPAEGVTESTVDALMISAEDFNKGLQESADFRALVFNAYGQKLTDIISRVEEISFGRIDIRLARLLTQHVVGEMIIHLTHQALASELGTAREVISRQLKEFERKGWVKLHRGSIEIIDSSALENLAQTPLM